MAEGKKLTVAEVAYSFYRKYGFRGEDGAERQVMRFWRGDFYLWAEGIYIKLSRDEMKSLMVKHVTSLHQAATTGLMDNLKLNILHWVLVGEDRVPDTWLSSAGRGDVPVNEIVMENGIISFGKDGTVEVKDHTPDFFCLGRLPYEYDPEAICERWMQFLEEVTGGDKGLQRLLQQWAGYLLSSSHGYQSFLLLIGEAGTGKGTFARAMKAMLGRKNCSEVPLRRFTDKFSMFLTYGKKLNIAGDAEQELTPQGEAIIKTWTGQDGLDYEKKYGDGFTADPTAKLMILANDFPTFTDKSGGTWRRLKIVQFDREDPTLVEKGLDETLRGELPGILNWAIRGLQDLEENEGFVMPEASQNLLAKHKEESNPAGMFLVENYQYDAAYYFGIRCLSLYKAYAKWCRVMGYMAMSSKTFGKEVTRAFKGKVVRKRLGTGTSRFYIYQGLKMLLGAEIGRILSEK